MKSALFFLVLATAVPAAAVTNASFDFRRSGGNASAASFDFVGAPASPLVGIAATARTFAVAPSALVRTSQFAAARPNVYHSVAGIGVIGGANNQLDTNSSNRREALVLSSNRLLGLRAVRFGWTDANDTVRIFGTEADGSLSLLASGNIRAGFTGATIDPGQTSAQAGNGNGNFARLLFSPRLDAYRELVFTTDLAGSNALGQGYFLSTVDAAIVPEPATWAMLIAGFGLVGATLRRQRRDRVAGTATRRQAQGRPAGLSA